MISVKTDDPLGVKTASNAVVGRARNVRINESQLEKLVYYLKQAGNKPLELDSNQFGSEPTVQKVFLLDTLNFCFWARKGQTKWAIKDNGRWQDGYWGLVAAIDRALAEGYPLLEASYWVELKLADLKRILRGKNGTTLPLINHRLVNLRQAGKKLVSKYEGLFENVVREAKYDAVYLVKLVTADFESFKDVSWYGKWRVPFYKRAQILAYDIGLLANITMKNLDGLTAMADYKLPQLLREHGVMEYDKGLADRIDAFQEIAAGSPEEVEIRAATVVAVDKLANKLGLWPVEVDNLLWSWSQKKKASKPYHRTRTIYY